MTTGVTIFEGDNCETNIDDCDPDPCLNSGQCIDLTNDYKCTCNPGFTGKNCESCTDGRLSCQSESNEINCVLHDDYCKNNTIKCTNSLNFVCPTQNYCPEDHFTCKDDKSNRLLSCISQDNYCIRGETCSNGYNFVCPPGSQNGYCDSPEKFACINEFNVFLKTCISEEKKCDGIFDCPNAKDEVGCVDTCNAEEVQCIHETGKKLPLQCISPAKQCDGISDCELNGEDEMGCPAQTTPTSTTTTSTTTTETVVECNENEYLCPSVNACLSKCNTALICPDVPKEVHCPDCPEFKCQYSGLCISSASVCNGVMDCPQNEDEENCCRPGQFQCGNGLCVDKDAICDGKYDCIDAADERDCSKFPLS